MDSRKCANCGEYVLDRAWQHQCGDRFCGDCYTALKYILLESGRSGRPVRKECPLCDEAISPHEFYRDKAIERELKTATIECTNQYCTWQGPGELYKEHIKTCVWTKVPCPNKFCGCPRRLLRKELDQHLRKGCLFAGKCPWCLETVDNLIVHYKKGCGYGQVLTKKNNEVPLPSEVTTTIQRLIDAGVSMGLERSLQDQLQADLTQANTYSGIFIWKIPEVQRRRREARSGRTVFLDSTPFYTDHLGYKMCVRIYLNGDGTGEGTHLSFFVALMKGENDPLLTWPFRHNVALMLLDQDRKKDIIKVFSPNPPSSSFQRPINDVNLASGFPQFAPLSVLDNPSYVKEDTMYVMVVVDISGILRPC